MKERDNVKTTAGKEYGPGELEKQSFDAQIASFYLWQAYKAFVAGHEETLKPWGINPSQCLAMWFMRYYDTPLTASRLAWLLALETHSITSLLDGLQKKGLIKRRRSRTDRRVIEIVLTENGRQMLAEIRHPYLEFLCSVFKNDFSEDEINTLINFLQRIWDAGYARLGIAPSKAHLVADKYVARMEATINALAKPGYRT